MSDSLNDILEGLGDEPFSFDIDDLPEEGGVRLPPPQPGGAYTWMIPNVNLGELWKSEDTTVDGKPAKRPRLYFTDNPLVVVAAPPGMDSGAGLAVAITISTRESRRGKDKVLVSDAIYLSRALGQRPTTLKDLVTSLSKAGGQLFDSDVIWETSCNPKRDVYAEGAVQVGTKGCGQGYGMRPRQYKDKNGAQQKVLVIPKAEGKWLDTFPCQGQRLGANGQPEACGAEIRVFPRLRNFRTASPEIVAAVKGNGHVG